MIYLYRPALTVCAPVPIPGLARSRCDPNLTLGRELGLTGPSVAAAVAELAIAVGLELLAVVSRVLGWPLSQQTGTHAEQWEHARGHGAHSMKKS